MHDDHLAGLLEAGRAVRHHEELFHHGAADGAFTLSLGGPMRAALHDVRTERAIGVVGKPETYRSGL